MKSLKRIFLLLILLISFFSFKQFSNVFWNHQYSYFWNGEELIDHYEDSISFYISPLDSNHFYQFLLNQANQKNLALYHGTNETIEGERYFKYYLYEKDSERFIKNSQIIADEMINFIDDDSKYYSADPTDSKANGTISISKKGSNLELYAFQMLKRNPSKVQGFYQVFGNKDDIRKFQSQLMNTYMSEGLDIIELSYFDLNEENNKKLNSVNQEFSSLLFCMLIVLGSIIIIKSLRMIAILKLHGFSSIKILKYLFLKPIILSLLIMVLLHVVCFYCEFNTINKVTIKFLPYLLRFYFQYILLYVICGFALSIYIKHTLSFQKFLKRAQASSVFLYIGWFLKLFVLCLCVSSVLLSAKVIYHNTSSVLKIKDLNLNRYLYSYTYDPNQRNKISTNDENKIMKHFDDRGGIYYDDTTINASKHTDSIIPKIIVNENYIKNFPIEVDGKRFDSINDNVTVLIPKNSQYSKESIFIGKDVVYRNVHTISIPSIYIRFQTSFSDEFVLNSPYLEDHAVVILPNGYMKRRKGIVDHYIVPQSQSAKFKSYLSKIEYGETLRYVDFNHLDNGSSSLTAAQDSIYWNSYKLISYLVIILLLTYQTTKTYMSLRKKESFIKILHGYSHIRIYYPLYAVQIIIYLLTGLYLGCETDILLVLLILLFIDTLMIAGITRFKLDYQSLKGED